MLTYHAYHSAIPASALDEEFQEDEYGDVVGEERDDEKSGTRYNVRRLFFIFEFIHYWNSSSLQYSWFHVIFVMAAMYVGMLLTDWYDPCALTFFAAI